MLTLTVTAKGKKQLEQAMLLACREIADKIYSEAQANLTERPYPSMGSNGIYTSHIIDTGELLSSGSVEPTKTGAKVEFSARHASDIEYGIPPGGHGPPAEVLAAWCQRKLGLSKKEALGAAYVIKQTIAAEGTTARPFLRDAVYTVVAQYKNKKVKE